MAQDAELKLKVSLDLAFFRQQLSTIGTQLGGQSVPIAIRFDKKAIADQYRLLDRYIRGKKFTVELNLVGGLTKNEFDKIKGRLDDLRELRKVEIPIGIKNGATGKDVDKVVASIKERLAQNQQIKQGGGKLRIETSVKPSITNQDIADFKKAVKDKLSKIGALEIPTKLDVPKVEDLLKALQKNINRQKPLLAKTSIKPSILSADVKAFKKAAESKLSGITVKINAELETIGGGKTKAQIEKEVLAGLERIQQMGAERMGGGVTEPARRESLRQSLQGRDIGELKDIGKQLGVAGVGKFRNTQNLIERIVTEASIEMITKYLDPQAVMRNPDRSGLNKVLDTFARGLFNMLGMDVASMRQQAAQRRALPGINFPATVPSRPVSIGPSSTGRALSAGAGPAGMIGAAQAPAGLLPSITARSSIKSGVEALFAAGGPQFPMAPSGKLALSTEALQARVDKILTDYFKIAEVTVKEIFNPQDLKRALNIFSYLPQALRDAESRTRQARIGITSAQGIAGLLPAAAGRAPSTYSTGAIGGESREQMMARRTAEAYARSALRGMDVMGGGAGRPPSPYSYAYRSARPTSAIVPYAQAGAIVPSAAGGGSGGAVPPSGGGGGGGFGGMRGFVSAMGGINLPGAGVIRELGSEFAFATKQVLLFGQAYKLLAFVQTFPGQVGEAVSQLQSFRNTLLSVTGSAGAAADANEFILAAVEKYSIPLQSARDGFTKLFASMEPAGFAAGEIQNLFLGISKAAATYGMSADKVDRVNYAFAQMASKGQVMSEELKGQLGDVLPGAMGIFAKAAGFEGPDAIQKFGKALEDGEYKGGKMRELLRNVANEMNKEFGPGAEGAARTFQGAINRMQTATAKLYESFEPAAIGVMNAVMVPFVQTLKNATDGVNAYFSGQQAATPAAQGFADILKTLVPTLTGVGENLKYVFQQVAVLIQGFGAFALQVGRLLALPIVRYLAGTYVQALLLTTAFKALATSGIGAALVAIARFIAQGVVYAQVTLGMRVATQQTTVAMYQFGTAVQTVMIKSVIGIALVAIGSLIAKFVELQNAMASVSGQSKQMQDAAKASAKLGDVSGVKEAIGNMEDRVQTYKRVKGELDRVIGDENTYGFYREIPSALASELMSLGLIVESSMKKVSAGYKVKIGDLRDAYNLATKNVSEFNKAVDSSQNLVGQAQKKNQQLKQQGVIDTSAEIGKPAAVQSLESLESLNDQIAKARTEGELEQAKIVFEYRKRLEERLFEMQESGANDVQKAGIKLAKDLFDIRMRFEQAVFEAGAAVRKEAGSVAPGNRPPKAPKGQGPYGPITQFGAGANANLRIGQQVGGPDMQRPVSGSERRDLVAVEKTQQTVRTESIRLTYELKKASEDYVQVIRQNFDTIFPVAQMQLQNQMLAARQQLELQAVPKEAIDAHLAIAEARAKGKAMQEELDKKLAQSIATIEKYSVQQEQGTQLTKQQTYELKEAEAFMDAYGQTVGEVAEKVKGFTIAQLESAIATMKQADALKVMEEVSGRINDAVTGVTDTYKSMFKEIAMGEDSVEALKKAQQALADQFLTMVFDMAMKPVEESMKNTLGKMFGVPTEKEKREESIKKMEEQLTQLKLIENNTAIAAGKAPASGAVPTPAVPGQMTAAGTSGGFLTGTAALQTLPFNGQTGGMLQNLPFPAGDTGFLSSIGINSEELSASISESANAYSEQLSKVDTSVFESANALGTAGTELGKEGAAGKKWHESLGQAVGGLGMAAGAVMGIVAGINQIKEGGTSNVLGGIGMIASMAGSLLGGFSGLFGAAGGGGGGNMGGANYFDPMTGKGVAGPNFGLAKGGIMHGGFMPFKAFANGGIVTGPTMGLVGEGRYSEAVVPLPDGRSIPVQLGGRSARDLMGNGAPGMPQAPSLSMKFETTKINGVEYVSREQLEQAMAETRRASIAGGAQRGMSMTLDRIKQSPSTRSSIGIR